MKVCRLYLSKPVSILVLLMILVWPMLGLIGIIWGLLGDSDGYGVVCAFIFVSMIGFAIAYGWLRIPFEIRVDDTTATATFRSVLGRTVVPLVQIRSLQAKQFAFGFVDLRHETGTLHLVSQMTGFHEFVLSVKSSNPTVRIEGC